MKNELALQKLKILLEQNEPPNPHVSEICLDLGGLTGCLVVSEKPRGVDSRFVVFDPRNGAVIEYGDDDNTTFYGGTRDDEEEISWVYKFLNEVN